MNFFHIPFYLAVYYILGGAGFEESDLLDSLSPDAADAGDWIPMDDDSDDGRGVA